MRQVAKKGLITVAAAGGVLALSGGTAFADSAAEGGAKDSPGVLSGNVVQVPVHVPVNICGNTVDIVGLLNPAFGNDCVNESGKKPERKAEKPAEKPDVPKQRAPEAPKEAQPVKHEAEAPRPETQTVAQPEVETQLAETGGSYDLALGLSLGTGLLLTGGVLYRRTRARQH